MAEMTIQLKIDPATGKKDIIIGLRSDDDALPHEHEQQHQALVEKLIAGGLVKQSELGKIIIERGEKEDVAAPTSAAAPQEERRSQAAGN